MNQIVNIKKSYAFIKQYLEDTSLNKNDQIRFYNFWHTQLPHEMWLARFIQHRKINSNYSAKINFYSVLGPVETLKYRRKGLNIFFSGENMHAERFDKYRQVCEKKPFDLSIGFDNNTFGSNVRFPLWILYMFEPESSFEDIKEKINQLSNVKIGNRLRFCSLVASHDWNGIRGEIIDALQSVDLVSSAGRFRQNTDELQVSFNDDKHKFLKQFKLNICPENSNAEGYVTEKIFQSIEAGCIPVYWGANNKPEPDILNQDAILCWNQGENNASLLTVIKELIADENKYIDFASQQRFLPHAAEVIWGYFETLEQQLKYLTTK
jgi:alpha(1,3/1,4) fucosyltransferase